MLEAGFHCTGSPIVGRFRGLLQRPDAFLLPELLAHLEDPWADLIYDRVWDYGVDPDLLDEDSYDDGDLSDEDLDDAVAAFNEAGLRVIFVVEGANMRSAASVYGAHCYRVLFQSPWLAMIRDDDHPGAAMVVYESQNAPVLEPVGAQG